MYFTDKQLVSLYFLGGISAGITYILAYNLFPYFQDLKQISILMGASGSILAIILATAIQAPNLEMRLLLIGAVKLKYIAAAVVVMSFFGITSHNAGGDIAHLGGALFGYFFVVSLRNGRDITRFFNRVMDFFIDLFKPRRLKVKHTQSQKRKMSDAEYNMHKASTMTEIDRILDKIKASGYGSLTDEEKRKLFEQSKK
jgi:membrane associated rhomboid family serine protease